MKKMKEFFSNYEGWFIAATLVFLLYTIIMVQEAVNYEITTKTMVESADFNEEKLREMLFYGKSLSRLQEYCKKQEKDFIKELTLRAILFNYELEDKKSQIQYMITKKYEKKMVNLSFYHKLYDIYKSIFLDLRYFPIPQDKGGRETVGYEDGFGDARTYGGKRRHEGTDLMPSINKRGYFPVVSVSDGIIENIGWLTLGGWRIGIRSNNGGYYYYAHLDSYAKGLKQGDRVMAGQLLGFMGDTGYSEIEGTKGKFVVHLHFGIYVDIDEKQVSINPYPVLNLLKKRQLAYNF